MVRRYMLPEATVDLRGMLVLDLSCLSKETLISILIY